MENWQKNQAALLQLLQDKGWSDWSAALPANASVGTLADVVQKAHDDASMNQAWETVANAVAAHKAQQQLGLSDLTSAANRDKLNAWLAADSPAADYPGMSNAAVIAKLALAGQSGKTNLTPDYAAVAKTITDYIVSAAHPATPTVTSQIVVREWANGVVVGTRTITVTSGQSVTLTPTAHDHLTFDYLTVNGVRQSSSDGTYVFKQSFDQSQTFNVDYIYKSTDNGGNGGNGGGGQTNDFSEQVATGIVYIKNTNGAAIYSDMAMTTPISGRTLAYGTAWSYFRKVFDRQGNLVGYNLGGQQYVKASDLQTTPLNAVSYQAFQGVVTVLNGGTPLYADAAMTQIISGRTLVAGTRWQAYQKVFINGVLAGYNLGGNQFVKADAVTVAGTTPSTPTHQIVPANGTVMITEPGGAILYQDAAMTQMIPGRSLVRGSHYRYNNAVYVNGQLAGFNLGGHQFVNAASVTSNTTLAGSRGVFTVRYPANAQWGIAVVGTNMQVQKIIPAGTRWQAYGTRVLADGQTYYNLGGDQWVRADYGALQ